jgi:RimJ/RimL family protein N-acetyltransferase
MNIATRRLILRPLMKATPRQVAWLRDPDVVRYSEQRHKEPSLSTQLRYIGSFGGRSRIWGIHHIDTGLHIGNITATHDEPNNVSDIGILIGEKHLWGQGYGSEAWDGVCNWLLDRDGGSVRKLEAGCMKNNEGMLKIIRKAKFVQEGERLNHFLFEGSPITAVLFGRAK